MYRDLQLIRHHQHPSGAFPASPSFSQYPYCWLRDGSFIAYAMDRAGVHASSRAFHLWTARTLGAQTDHILGLVERAWRDEVFTQAEFLPARFTLEGEWREDGWPNFQLDGYGQWLWALGEHLRLGGEEELPGVFAGPVRAVLAYLERFWAEPCYDPWEENPTRLHTATLASIYAGFSAMAPFFPLAAKAAREVRRVVLEECVREGRFVKFVGESAVDASLLWVSVPFDLVDDDDPRMLATVAEIERRLLRGGGVVRYAADTYYGGGAWILLTAWLGWYYARTGSLRRARELCAWVEAHRDERGHLPEQVAVPGISFRFLNYWTRRWGVPARPLLWSHAMQVILKLELRARRGG